jgi:hypothetical protein
MPSRTNLVLHGMTKQRVLLDWYGNPIQGFARVRHKRSRSLTFKGESDADGKRYLRTYTADGQPGDRVALDDDYLRIEDTATGKVRYDSRMKPPPDAKLLPGYIGYEREKQLKRYFPG